MDGSVKNGSAPIIRDLDALPDPDYDEFFAALMRLGRQEVLGKSLPASPLRERARLLVGSEAPLHVLRAERARDGLSLEVAGARA